MRPLHYSVKQKDHKITELLIQYGAKVNDISEDSYTPFHLACKNCDLESMKYLYEKGADPHIKDRNVNIFFWGILHILLPYLEVDLIVFCFCMVLYQS